jgi:GR25 family glycosyltransferase involved in LPS biosynthesis
MGVSPNDIVFYQDNIPYYIFDNLSFFINKTNMIKYTNRTWVRFGEIAALMAHYRLWKEISTESNEIVYLICEDDCLPSDTFKMENLKTFDYTKIDFLYLQAITAHYQSKKDVLNKLDYTEWDQNLKHINKFKNYMCEGLAAYCITKTGAQKLCEYIEKNGYDGPVDNIIVRLENFECVCPTKLEDYFNLDDTSKYSYTHTGTFNKIYNLNGIELQSNKELQVI